jgi:MFS transporter, YNFM family, putative membrane transport protein
MFPSTRWVLLTTTILSFCSLYLPQPILPVLARTFEVSRTDAALLVGITLMPLAVAPIIYGYFLQSISARRLLLIALSLMAVSQIVFALAPSYPVALASRLLLGLALPAAFTAVMTMIAATAPPERVREAMGVYVATTIVGGFVGRALGGMLSAAWDWRAPFVVMAVLLVLNVALLTRLASDSGTNFARPGLRSIGHAVSTPHFRYSFLTIFCVFFVFAGILNNLPFRLEEIDPTIRESDIAMIYTGYLVGVLAALGAARISNLVGGERRGLWLALGVFFIATALFTVPSFLFILANVFAFSIGMFAVHSLLSALVNQHAGDHRSVVNGLYIAIYYSGGSLGAWLPSWLYSKVGWDNLLHVMNAVVVIAFVLMPRIFKSPSIRSE